MKILGRLFLSLSLIVVLGCSKDSDNETPVQQQEFEITGNWRLQSYNYFGSRTDILNDEVTQTEFVGVGWDMDMNLVLADEPNSYTYTGTYFVDHVVTTEEGNEILYYGYFDVDDVGTWIRSNNSFNLVIDGETSQGVITELTENTLEYRISTSSSETTYDGLVINITRTDTYNYVRQ